MSLFLGAFSFLSVAVMDLGALSFRYLMNSIRFVSDFTDEIPL